VESNRYFPPFAESQITWIGSAQPKMPIVHFRKKILDGRVPPVQDTFTECDDRFFRKKIGKYSCCAGHYLLSVLFVF
jgi:hypothetical protein